MQSEFATYFQYDETSPTCLRWKVDIYSGRNKKQVSAGAVAGYYPKNENRYCVVGLDGKLYQAHRVIWELHNSSIPDEVDIDHIDRDRKNNTIQNLRLATTSVNMRNKGKQKSNSSGCNVVGWKTSGTNTYAASRWVNEAGGQSQKYFSVKKHGLLPAFKMACEYRIKMIEELNQQGAGYTENHGK